MIVFLAMTAFAGLAAPVAGQETEDLPVHTNAIDFPPVPEYSLELRIQQARAAHERNRLFGSVGVALGTTAILGALLDWVDNGEFGMSSGAAGVLFGGVPLIAWGGERLHTAAQALQRAEMWEARAGSVDHPE